MNLVINKQSSIFLQDGKTIYFDPWDLTVEAPKADAIFITHEHSDHYSPKDIAKLMTDETLIVVPKSMAAKAEKDLGRSVCAVVPGQTYLMNELHFETVPAYNLKKPFHSRKSGWCGYVVMLNGARYYAMGDTDKTPEAVAVKCDVAFVPIGGMFTMNLKQAVECIGDMQPGKAVPIHYGSVVGKVADGEKFKSMMQKAHPQVQVEVKL